MFLFLELKCVINKNPYLNEETNIRIYGEDGDHQQAKECARK